MKRAQPVVTLLLLAATGVAYQCPCPRTLSCHLKLFYALTGSAVALVAMENA